MCRCSLAAGGRGARRPSPAPRLGLRFCATLVRLGTGPLGLRGPGAGLGLPFPAPVVAILEHIQAARVQRPVAAFARPPFLARHLDEAVVEGEVVPDAVLPALPIVVVEGEAVHYELVDAVERDPLLGRVLDCHGYERNVAVGRLLRGLRPARGSKSGCGGEGQRQPGSLGAVQIEHGRGSQGRQLGTKEVAHGEWEPALRSLRRRRPEA